jgi:hypothetical protein
MDGRGLAEAGGRGATRHSGHSGSERPDDGNPPGGGGQALPRSPGGRTARAAARTGVVISAVTPNATASTTNSVALAVSVEGTYFQIRDFLHRLRTQVSVKKGGMVQAGGRLFDVTGVNISQPTAGSPTLTANLSVNAYAYDTGIAPVTPAAAPTDATATGGTTTGAPN